MNGLRGCLTHRTYEQELERFKEEDPGFGDGCCALAIGAGIRDMR